MTLYEEHVARCDYVISITRHTNNFQLSFFIHKDDFQIMHNKAPENLLHTPQRYSSPLWHWMSKGTTYFPIKTESQYIYQFSNTTATAHQLIPWTRCNWLLRHLLHVYPHYKSELLPENKMLDRHESWVLGTLTYRTHLAPCSKRCSKRHHSSQTCFDAYQDWLTNIRDLNIKL